MAAIYDGTITSKLKPVVTLLTEALVKDFELAYCYAYSLGARAWFERTDEAGGVELVEEEVLREDVKAWLSALETEHEDQEFARMVLTMIRKNKGWIALLSDRLVNRLKAGISG